MSLFHLSTDELQKLAQAALTELAERLHAGDADCIQVQFLAAARVMGGLLFSPRPDLLTGETVRPRTFAEALRAEAARRFGPGRCRSVTAVFLLTDGDTETVTARPPVNDQLADDDRDDRDDD